MKKESVLCYDDIYDLGKLLRGDHAPLVPMGFDRFNGFLKEVEPWFVPRSNCEHNDGFRQVIPYVVLRCANSIAFYRRASKGGDPRLQSKWSIGLGGHVSMDDCRQIAAFEHAEQYGWIMNACLRELEEEVGLLQNDMTSLQYGGHLIVSNATEVDRVHMGVVMYAEIPRPEKIRRCALEKSIADFEWMAPNKDYTGVLELESWSKLLLAELSKL